MANKQWLDAEGLETLVEHIKLLHNQQQEVIDTLNASNNTPGSIGKMINDAIAQLDTANLFHGDTIYLYGGSASEVMEEADE